MEVAQFSKFKIFQSGAGGTGGYLSLVLHKFINDIAKKKSLDIEYSIFDFDVVEKKNIKRQNFFECDIDENKAKVIGERYGIDFCEIGLTPDILNLEMLKPNEGVNVILGCTDSVQFRIDTIRFLKQLKPEECLWVYIDGGNLDTGGQVLVEHNLSVDNIYSENMDDIEKIFVDALDDEVAVSTDSCSDLGDQTIGMNLTSALFIYNIVTEFISTSKISCNSIVFRRYLVKCNVDQGMAMLNRTW